MSDKKSPVRKEVGRPPASTSKNVATKGSSPKSATTILSKNASSSDQSAGTASETSAGGKVGKKRLFPGSANLGAKSASSTTMEDDDKKTLPAKRKKDYGRFNYHDHNSYHHSLKNISVPCCE